MISSEVSSTIKHRVLISYSECRRDHNKKDVSSQCHCTPDKGNQRGGLLNGHFKHRAEIHRVHKKNKELMRLEVVDLVREISE